MERNMTSMGTLFTDLTIKRETNLYQETREMGCQPNRGEMLMPKTKLMSLREVSRTSRSTKGIQTGKSKTLTIIKFAPTTEPPSKTEWPLRTNRRNNKTNKCSLTKTLSVSKTLKSNKMPSIRSSSKPRLSNKTKRTSKPKTSKLHLLNRNNKPKIKTNN